MFHRLMRMAATVRARLWGSGPPEDPYLSVREPRRRGPSGNSSTVAVAEPDPETRTRAVGRLGGSKPD